MKKNIVLLGALAFALVAQTEAATVTKVKFVFNGYYQGDQKVTSITNSAGVITTTSSAMVPFKITDADVLAGYGAPASAYLIGIQESDSKTGVYLVNGPNDNIKVLDIANAEVATYVDKYADYTKGTQWKKVRTTYLYNKGSLPPLPKDNNQTIIWGGAINKDAVSVSYSSLDVSWAAVNKSSSAGVNGVTSSSAHSFTSDKVVGTLQITLPHKTTDEATDTRTGVIVSGAVRAAEVTVK